MFFADCILNTSLDTKHFCRQNVKKDFKFLNDIVGVDTNKFCLKTLEILKVDKINHKGTLPKPKLNALPDAVLWVEYQA